jgi:tetrahydromethanopterin S-methyltransferase subunit G
VPVTTAAPFDREIGMLIARFEAVADRLKNIDTRLDRIETRLDAGDQKFESTELEKAHERGARKVALKIGIGVLTVLTTVGSYFLTYVPPFLEAWFKKP